MPNPAAYTAIRSYKKNRTANKPSYFHSPEIQALFANAMRPGGKAASGRNAETKFTRTFA